MEFRLAGMLITFLAGVAMPCWNIKSLIMLNLWTQTSVSLLRLAASDLAAGTCTSISAAPRRLRLAAVGKQTFRWGVIRGVEAE